MKPSEHSQYQLIAVSAHLRSYGYIFVQCTEVVYRLLSKRRRGDEQVRTKASSVERSDVPTHCSGMSPMTEKRSAARARRLLKN